MINDHAIATAMQTYGGNFIQKLAAMWFAADDVNRARIQRAFAEEWIEYADLLQRRARAHAAAEWDLS